jgi:AraC-like DNA-binding protein
MNEIISIKSIAQAHELLGLPAPQHPLISVHLDKETCFAPGFEGTRITFDTYLIMFKDKVSGSMGYGRNSYDFQESTLVFMGPGQVVEIPPREVLEDSQGWSLAFHPDLIRKSHLAAIMDEYSFFSYDVNEALHLSAEEQNHILQVVHQIQKEYSQPIDRHSQRLIISNLELLLNYCTRFYDRQFYTRTNFSQDFVSVFERSLKAYFNSDKPRSLGIPPISYFGKELNMSTNYLSDMLKKETGKSAKAHINELLIEKAKTALLNSTDSVSQIAYELGFEYPQSLSRLFKAQTGVSPQEYRTIN